MHSILVLTGVDGSRESEIALTTWYEEMKEAAQKYAVLGEVFSSTWVRRDLTPKTDVEKITPTIESADAVLFLTYARPSTNLDTFIKTVGAYASKPNRLPNHLLGFVFIGEEDPKDLYYFDDLFRHARRMKMNLSAGMLWIQKGSSRLHEKYALQLVELLGRKAINEQMLEPS